MASAAREANDIIDQRAFSWTELFAQFEATLPADVRITAVQPRLDEGTASSWRSPSRRGAPRTSTRSSRRSRTTGAFHNVLPSGTQTNDDGLLEAIVEGVLRRRHRATATQEAPSGQ